MKPISIIALAIVLSMAAVSFATEPIHGGTGSVVSDLSGTANQVIITDDGDGTATASTPQDIDTGATPTFANTTLNDLTPNMLVRTGVTNAMDSGALGNFVSGTSNQVAVTDAADGAIVLSTPQDLDVGATPTLANVTLTDLSADRLTRTGATSAMESAGLGNFVSGTANQITVTDTATGGVQLATPQDIDTAADVIFNSVSGTDRLDLYGGSIRNAVSIINGTFRLGEGDYIDIPIGLSTAVANPSKTPTYSTFINNTSSWNFTTSDFGDYLDFEVKVPHSHEIESDLDLHSHLSPNSSVNTGNVLIEVECTTFAGPGEAFSASTVIYNGVQAIDGTPHKHYSTDLGIVSGTGITFGEMAKCAITRRAAQDEFVDAIFPLVAGFHIRVDSLGADFVDSKTPY